MKNTTIAVDLAKSVFEVAASEWPGRISQQHHGWRNGVRVGVEAYGRNSSRLWQTSGRARPSRGEACVALGHEWRGLV